MHKKACKKRAAVLHEEALFKEHPPPEECPICMLPLPYESETTSFKSCCGKVICAGCLQAMIERDKSDLCPFCRTPSSSSYEEEVKRLEKLMEKGNSHAFYVLGVWYARGTSGLQQDLAKANDLYLKAGELGCADAYYNLGNSYGEGWGVKIDMKKAKHYLEIGAMKGDVKSRNNIGCFEEDAGNLQRAFKHWIIGAKAGNKHSLDAVKKGYMDGYVTKDDYAQALRGYQKSQDEIKSDMRDKARALR
jgi:TPR repeat protein